MFEIIIISRFAIMYARSLGLIRSFAANPIMIGIETIKLYSAAARGLSPITRLAIIVEPERDTPGINANACAKPIANERFGLRSLPTLIEDFFGILSTTIIKTPTSASIRATTSGLSKTALD